MKLSNLLFCVLLFCTALVFAQDEDPGFSLPVPAYNHDVRFCGLPSDPNYTFDYQQGTSQCDFPTYGRALAKLAIPAIVMLGIAILSSIVLIFVLCCSCCKGGKRSKILNFIIIGIFAACAIVGMIVTFTGNNVASNSVNTIADTIQGAFNESIGILDSVAQTIEDEGLNDFDSGFMDTLAGVRENFVQLNSSAVDAIDRVHYYDSLRKTSVFVGAIVPTVLIALGIIFIIIGFTIPLALLGWLCIFLSAVVWLSLAVHLASGKVISDICWEMDLSLLNGEAGPLSILIDCNKEDGIVGSLRVQLEEVIETRVTDTCDQINNDVCSRPEVDCSGYVCDGIDSLLASKNLTVNDMGTTRTIEECSEQCTNVDLRDASSTLMDAYNLFVRYLRVAYILIDYLDCQFIIDAFNVVRDTICEDFIFSLQQVFAGNALQGIGMTGSMVIMVHVFKGS